MTEAEVKADRYAKFRKLGQFEDHVVIGGAWRETREERSKVSLLTAWPDRSPIMLTPSLDRAK